MLRWQLASALFFAYLLAAAAIRPGLTRAARGRVVAVSLVAAVTLGCSLSLPAGSLANVWLLPGTLLLIAYWTSGLLFVAPMPAAERALVALDRGLRVHDAAARTPRPLAEVLEAAYTGVYLLIPIALFVALRAHVDPDRFWTTVLVTDFVCFGTMPWFQTRPPRSLGIDAPWRSSWRAFNLRLLHASSVRVNTFPSGHAAEALVAALLVVGGPPAMVAVMFVCALLVSAGAVLGRYHYAADALAGWAVALTIWGMS